jgi:hypothetical protein
VPGAMTAVSGATIVGLPVREPVVGSAIVASAPSGVAAAAPSGAVRAVRPGSAAPVPASTVYASIRAIPRPPFADQSRPAQPATAPRESVTPSPPTEASQASVMTSPKRRFRCRARADFAESLGRCNARAPPAPRADDRQPVGSRHRAGEAGWASALAARRLSRQRDE